MSVFVVLKGIPPVGSSLPEGDWFVRIERSLEEHPQDWVTAATEMGEDDAWSLLSWAEVAANHIVRSKARRTLITSAFAVSIVLQSGIDWRECSLVASLLHRAADLSGIDFAACAAEGCALAGSVGEQALPLLLGAGAKTPSTHVDSGTQGTFSFTRRAPEFDVHDLMRRLGASEG
ncbi:hypothetical protein BKG80_06750 [Mycobacteroides chelonae]|jgi:hypothetical protein|uniref:hypothetical protein n=1 Tax=Mycobacteroides TaxID=670516 RepID=UPI000714851A|nr:MULTISPECIES: hypothetical protein [Mycobacteroides]KRQ28133.1 hypothetical protein AOT86_09605 [Mycobacteroides sp. H072]KRQ34077.1 hypothetical protein AOT84_19280 [Mycobacteroides sp. H002]KRQ53736.1 hypothetical protein AOT85_06710 [Mycobacteroides sp. H054]KRQ66635.1 hypothetical protein AOT83_22185 [Mycobacteroides sp. H001]MBF9350310.1 hypothetical protein [Mycobacteroides chelonae]